MPLPAADAKWPPQEWVDVQSAYAEWAAWYSSSPDALATVYGAGVSASADTSLWGRIRAFFWGRASTEFTNQQRRSQLHMPLASDMAATSAALLFGEAPSIIIPEAHEDTVPAGAKETEQRLHDIIREGDIENRLLEAADTCAALGGVFIKPDWDESVIDMPMLTVVQADNAIPEFRYGRLMAVTLWRVVQIDNQTVWRHFERHTPGYIEHALYKGRGDNLGQRLALDAHPETDGLEDILRLPFDTLGIRYIPNLKPNRRFRGSALGQSDYAGAEGILDALDETWTSWMRDIRLAKARIMVPEEFLQRSGTGTSAHMAFDIDQEVFTPLDMGPNSDKGITATQFEIRVDEHERTVANLIEAIVGHAGYSPQTFGLHIEGRADSGTALRIRERKTLSTQQKKVKAWSSPLADVFEMMLEIDRAVFKKTSTVFRPQVTMADSLTPDENETATTVELLNRAAAISDYMKVKRVNPGWDEEQIQAEVQRIREGNGLAVPDAMQIGELV